MKRLLLMLSCILLLAACGGGGGTNAPNNSVTAANAGVAQNIRALTTVTLDGSHSTGADGKLITYQWSFVNKPSGSNAVLSNANIVNPTFVPDVQGVFVLSLIVNDGTKSSSASTVTITASKANSIPIANAGVAQNTNLGQTIRLDGSLSSDADNDLITYQWSIATKPAGSTVALSSSTVVNPTFTPDLAGNYTLNLVVNDGYVNSTISSTTVTVARVNSAPIANPGITQNVITGTLVTLDGSRSSDSDGDQLTYSWSFTSKPGGSVAALSNYASVNPTFTPDFSGAYVLNLVVNDGKANSISVPVTINATRSNAAPVANIQLISPQNVYTGWTASLSGYGSTDANGDVLTYSWSLTSKPVGSNASLYSADPAQTTITPDVVGTYVISLVANDGITNSLPTTVTVTAYKPYSFTTFAGKYGTPGETDGVGEQARFGSPSNIISDGTNLYVYDSVGAFRKIVIATGQVTTLAGTATNDRVIIDGIGATACFYNPTGMAIIGNNLFFADGVVIRKIDILTRSVTTFAGNGREGYIDDIGTNAQFKSPMGMTSVGNNLYVADNYCIRKIDTITGNVTTFAGSPLGFFESPIAVDGIGTTAKFASNNIVSDGTNLYAYDGINIRKVNLSTSMVTSTKLLLSDQYLRPNGDFTTDGVYLYFRGNTFSKVKISDGSVMFGYIQNMTFNPPLDLAGGICFVGSNLYITNPSGNILKAQQ